MSDRASWLDERPSRRGGRFAKISRFLAPAQRRHRSFYLRMRDGVGIAVDVYLPPQAERGERVPAIVHQTRYFRGVELRSWFARAGFQRVFEANAPLRQRFLDAGYAWVSVCARGSGASHGWRLCPWSPDEVADGAEVVDWIIAQPWSTGVVGATGVSYAGTAAEMLLVNQHPAVKAIIPRFSLFDVYPDIAFPGGIQLESFTSRWARFNRGLDGNQLDDVFASKMAMEARSLAELPGVQASPLWRRVLAAGDRPLALALYRAVASSVTTGVRKVDDDDGELLARAVSEHIDNMDVHVIAEQVEFRDDPSGAPAMPEATADLFSPHAYADKLRGSGTAVYSVSGWMDGAYQLSAIKRFAALAGSHAGHRLILGPWDHGGDQDTSHVAGSSRSDFDHAGDMLRFFDHHLRGLDNGVAGEPGVRYFTVGEERWKSASGWPPPGARPVRYHLGECRALVTEVPERSGADEYVVDPEVGTGKRARWDSLLGMKAPLGYGDRAASGERMLVYRSAPLDRPTEVTGHPIVRLVVTGHRDDMHVFAYLEDEAPDGRVQYVTEGLLRGVHRALAPGAPWDMETPYHTFERAAARPLVPGERAELVFDLYPISYRFARGHRVRLALAGADRDHFARLPGAARWAVHRGGDGASYVELPVMPVGSG